MSRTDADGNPQPLTLDDCWRHLEQNVVGRVGFDVGHGPRIHPVNYAVDERTILVRTDPGAELGRFVELFGDAALVAFEVDHVDLERHRGWSVLLQGTFSQVSAAAEVALVARWSPHPWVGGARPLLARISPVQVTGRLIGRDW